VLYHSPARVFPPTPNYPCITTFEPCNHTINGNDNVMFPTNNCSFFLLAFSVHIMCLPTNLANSLSGLSFSAEVILGMYLLIGPPHSRSNYAWCSCLDEFFCSLWNFSLLIFKLWIFLLHFLRTQKSLNLIHYPILTVLPINLTALLSNFSVIRN
jgi:hypothetical protein